LLAPDDLPVLSHPRVAGFKAWAGANLGNLVGEAANTSFASHLSQKAIDEIFDTYLPQSEL